MNELTTFGFDPDIHTAAFAVVHSAWTKDWELRHFDSGHFSVLCTPCTLRGQHAMSAMVDQIRRHQLVDIHEAWIEYTAIYKGEERMKDSLSLLHLVSGAASMIVDCPTTFVEPKYWMWKVHKPQSQADILRMLGFKHPKDIPFEIHGDLGRNFRTGDYSHPVDAAGVAMACAFNYAKRQKLAYAKAKVSELRGR